MHLTQKEKSHPHKNKQPLPRRQLRQQPRQKRPQPPPDRSPRAKKPQAEIPHLPRRKRRSNDRDRIRHDHRSADTAKCSHDVEGDEVGAEGVDEGAKNPPCGAAEEDIFVAVDGAEAAGHQDEGAGC